MSRNFYPFSENIINDTLRVICDILPNERNRFRWTNIWFLLNTLLRNKVNENYWLVLLVISGRVSFMVKRY